MGQTLKKSKINHKANFKLILKTKVVINSYAMPLNQVELKNSSVCLNKVYTCSDMIYIIFEDREVYLPVSAVELS